MSEQPAFDVSSGEWRITGTYADHDNILIYRRGEHYRTTTVPGYKQGVVAQACPRCHRRAETGRGRTLMRQLIPLALSVNTVAVMWLAGSKRSLGWLLGLAGQGLWIVFSVVFEAWGLLPLAAVLIVVYARNLWRWTRLEPVRQEATDAR